MRKEHRFFDDVVIVTFLIGLFVPLALTNNRAESLIEKRKLAPFPKWKWNKDTFAAFPMQFQDFFNDHFGFRDEFARMYYLFSAFLKDSSSQNVLIGKEGWLFYINPNDGNSLEDYRKIVFLTNEQLWQWKQSLETKYTWLKERGIDYLFIIAPDKHSIYGEYFPTRIRQIGTQSCLDQFMEYMKDSDVPIFDLRQALIQAKPKGQLYFKTDAHWNDFGASIAQYAIMQHLAKSFPHIQAIQYQESDFLWELGGIYDEDFFWTDGGKAGDLAKMLNLAYVLKEARYPRLQTPLPVCQKNYAEQPHLISTTFSTNCDAQAPRALIFRDSFFTILQPYISQYFSKSLYVWKRPDIRMLKDFVEQYAPDIVIEERVERYLQFIPTPQR